MFYICCYVWLIKTTKIMIEKIKEVYERINNEFLSMSPFGPMNSKNFRTEFKERLQNEIVNSVIKCDEENNSPEIIDFCCLVAKISWTENHQHKYCNLVFGQPKQAIKILQKIW